MSFKKMRVEDLYNMATTQFGVEVPETATKPQIIIALEENGVTWAMAKQFDAAAAAVDVEEVAAPAPAEETDKVVLKEVTSIDVKQESAVKVEAPVLVKMNRENPTYNVRGYTFTSTHPFVLVSPEDANFICAHEEGFSMATPAEAAAFYA